MLASNSDFPIGPPPHKTSLPAGVRATPLECARLQHRDSAQFVSLVRALGKRLRADGSKSPPLAKKRKGWGIRFCLFECCCCLQPQAHPDPMFSQLSNAVIVVVSMTWPIIARNNVSDGARNPLNCGRSNVVSRAYTVNKYL